MCSVRPPPPREGFTMARAQGRNSRAALKELPQTDYFVLVSLEK